jgi:hypothetical protein
MTAPGARLGELLRFKEDEYKYGIGPLALRVTQLLNSSTIDGWIELKGIEIRWDGSRGDERQVWVLQSAIPEARRREQ